MNIRRALTILAVGLGLIWIFIQLSKIPTTAFLF